MKYIIYLILFFVLFSSCEKEQSYVTSIQLDKSELVLNVGEEYQFVAFHEASDAPTPHYIWSVSDKAKASISNTGLLSVYKD